jgi:hypothetical protein
MTKAELVADIYRRLPPDAQREAIDFLLKLKQRNAAPERSTPPSDAMAILEQVGFIGSLDAEPELSAHYKAVLSESLSAKHDHR